jgi:hypothetical protein
MLFNHKLFSKREQLGNFSSAKNDVTESTNVNLNTGWVKQGGAEVGRVG